MAILLSIETSTHSFSCALHDEGNLLLEKKSVDDQTTASMLSVMIEELFDQTKISKNELNGVVVASGPGSYTGLRIGVATAKGICYALDCHLLSVETLKVMAFQGLTLATDGLLCPMLDARRMEVYCAVYDQNLNHIQSTEAKVINSNSFENLLQQPMCFFGDGADKCKEVIRHPNARFVADIKPSAKALGEMGFANFLESKFEDLEHFEPFYLKDFIVKKPNFVSGC